MFNGWRDIFFFLIYENYAGNVSKSFENYGERGELKNLKNIYLNTS